MGSAAGNSGTRPAARCASVSGVIMFIFRAVMFLASSAIGLLVADWLLEGVTIDWSQWQGFVFFVLIFAVLQSVLAPWIATMARRYAPALLGGIGIFSTLIALLVAVFVAHGVTIDGLGTWFLATFIIWLATALATLLLPLIFFKKKVAGRDDKR